MRTTAVVAMIMLAKSMRGRTEAPLTKLGYLSLGSLEPYTL
jgi:hypothetical protein